MERLINATTHLTAHHIATHINTLVIRSNCHGCDRQQQWQHRQVMQQLLQQLMPHLTVLLHKGSEDEHPWEYTLFVVNQADSFHEDCQPGINIYTANSFNRQSGRPQREELFPLRFTNLSNCALNVTAQSAAGRNFMYRAPAGDAALPMDGALVAPQLLRGIDGELLQLLAQALNFRIRLLLPREGSEIFGADNVTGCFAQLARGEADLAIGGLSGSDQRRRQFFTSMVYHQSNFVFVVRTERFFGRFGQLARPFRGKVWCFLSLTVAAALLCTRALREPLQLRQPVESLLGSSIGNSTPWRRLPRCSFPRFLFASWLLLTLVLRAAYQAKLCNVLRLQRHQPLPSGLAALLQRNYTLLSTAHYDFYPKQLTRLVAGNFSARFEQVQQSATQPLVTIALINNLLHYNRLHRNSSRLTQVREPIYLFQQVIYFPNNSIFKYSIDRKIEQLLSSGVIAHIEQRYLRYNLAELGNYQTDGTERMTNAMFGGVYRCYALLLALAGFIFCLECLSLRWSCVQQLLSWLQ
ncbi:uncharacterized protein LOC108605092 [Drosophila busckii]|uniref:uncharacterized protein LOC108605092 n=1 Tax=Drosophila busckii TaxID=30019 RepID=UPI001432C0F9|nr:uncharacterized protein LOC108605092 [Drosophila busckii]